MSLFDVTLTVGGDVISAFDISEIIVREEFTKARQFEINVLDEARTAWALDEVVQIDYGFASPKTLIGRVDGIDKRGGLAILTGRDVSYETLDRPVDKEYSDTEAVAIMKDLIDTYAGGVLTYANATASAATIASIYPLRISMLDAFNKIIYFAESVDGDSFIWYLDADKDLHTFAEGDVDNGRELEWMIEIFDYRRIRDSWRTYDKVTVYGSNDSSGSAGAGDREKIIIDEFIDTDVACAQRAVTELKKSQARSVYALTCMLALDGPTIGERVFVTLEPEDIEMAFIVYAVEDHLYSGVTVVEVGESVAGFADALIEEHVLDEYMKQIKPAAALVEGDYLTWTHVWTRDYGAGINIDGFHVSNIGTVYSSTSAAEKAFIRTYAGVEDNKDDYTFGMLFHPRWHASSVIGRYLVAQNTGGVDSLLEIWKDGVMIWSRYTGDDTAEAFYPELVGMSPNGKYMAVGAISSLTFDTQLVMLYEGS